MPLRLIVSFIVTVGRVRAFLQLYVIKDQKPL
jgi:hypothetical protein